LAVIGMAGPAVRILAKGACCRDVAQAEGIFWFTMPDVIVVAVFTVVADRRPAMSAVQPFSRVNDGRDEIHLVVVNILAAEVTAGAGALGFGRCQATGCLMAVKTAGRSDAR